MPLAPTPATTVILPTLNPMETTPSSYWLENYFPGFVTGGGAESTGYGSNEGTAS